MIARSTWLPWAALVCTVVIWASYLVVVRAAMVSAVSPADIGFLRTAPAAVLLLPFVWRNPLTPGGATRADVALIGLMGGGAFVLLLALGLQRAPTVDGGIFTPTILPVWVAVLTVLFVGGAYSRIQISGLALILVGAGTLGGYAAIVKADASILVGHVLFLGASLSWAIYTVRFRSSRLSPMAATAIMAILPATLFGIALLYLGSDIPSMPANFLAIQIVQGIAAGLVANFTFFYAIRHLGPKIPAASAALVPALAGLGAWAVLGEPVGWIKLAGMALAATGVVLASGLLDQGDLVRKQRRDIA